MPEQKKIMTNALTTEQSPWWAKLLDRYGVPTVMLVAMGFAGSHCAVWFAQKVAEPLVNSHMDFLSTMKVEAASQTAAMKIQSSTLEQIADGVRASSDQLKKNSEILQQLRDIERQNAGVK